MNNDTIFTLNISLEQVNVIMQALSELPAKLSLKVILEIENQVRSQMDSPESKKQSIE